MVSGLGEDHAPPRGFLRRYVFSTDHKVIAKQFLFLGLAFLAVGGFLAMLIRWQLANPGAPFPLVGKLLYGPSGGVISPAAYTALFTMHGTIMIFFAITPILIPCRPAASGRLRGEWPVTSGEWSVVRRVGGCGSEWQLPAASGQLRFEWAGRTDHSRPN